MTDMYTHQWPQDWPVISPEAARLQWSHSVHEESNYLSEWQAQEHASTLADEMGSSSLPRIDVISLQLRKNPARGQVTFCDEVEVMIGHDATGDFRSTWIEHDALGDFDDKPWGLRSRSTCAQDQPIPNFDVTSLMARRPSQPVRPPSSSTSSSTSTSSIGSSIASYDPSEDWRQTVLVLLDGRMFPARLPWNNADEIVPLIQRAMGDPRQELYGAHHVRHRPHDLLQQGLECLLIQTEMEPRPSTFLRLILVDMEIFEPNEVLPGAFRRFSRWLPETINRASVFRLLGLEQLQQEHPDRSRLWYNNVEINEGTMSPMYLHDGDYIHLLIGEHEEGYRCANSSSTSFQTNATEEEDIHSSLQVTWLHHSSGASPHLPGACCPSRWNCTRAGKEPLQMSMNEPFTFFGETSTADAETPDPFRHPPRVERPVWCHEMWDLLRAHGEVEMEEEGPVIYIASHYISHNYHTMNPQMRPLRIDTDHEAWAEDLKFMWEDYFDHNAPFDLHLVRPNPPMRPTQSFVATVLVVQHPRPGLAACVLTAHDDEDPPSYVRQSAHSTATFTPMDTLVALSDHGPLCLPIDPLAPDRCRLQHGNQDLPPTIDVQIWNGLGLALQIPRARLHSSATMASLDGPTMHAHPGVHGEEEVGDEVQLFSVGTTLSKMTPHPQECHPPWNQACSRQHGIDLPPVASEQNFYQLGTADPTQQIPQWNPQAPDPFLNDLFGLWDLLAFTWEDEPRSGTVLVWFIDHQWEAPHCLAPRPVRLFPAFREWRTLLWQAWAEFIVLGTKLEYHLVTPKPPTIERNILAHVLLVQRPRPHWASFIISCFDARPPRPEARQLAITTRNIIHLDDMLQILGLSEDCNAPVPVVQCVAWHRDFIIRRTTPMPGHSGLAILLQVSLILPPPVVAQEDEDEVATLQTSARVRPESKTLLIDELVPPSPKVLVDFTHAAEAYYSIMNLTFDYMQTWPLDLGWPDETMQAITTLTEYTDLPIMNYHFYVDGSKVAGHGVGAATACLVETDQGIALAGIIPVHVDFADHAYIGEHAAMLHALLWAVQLSTWHLQRFPNFPMHVSFNFDALNTGYQAAGWWRAHEHKEWQTIFRSLAHILENRHGARHIAWNHIRAHAQHPWNELVDRVAKFASMHPDRVGNCQQWQPWLTDASFLTALQWIWYLETMRAHDPQAAPLHGLFLEHTLQISDPQNEVNDASAPDTQVNVIDIKVDMLVATANVLTMMTNADSCTTSTTRQQILMRQFHDAGCQVVGLQETRHRHLRDLSNPYYHILGAPATAEGQDGVQLWVSKTLPFYHDGPPARKQDLLVVEASATYMVTKVQLPHWRCLFVTARAPHSGHGLPQAERFWATVSAKIRQLSRTWPVIFLGDTNGHLGEQVTTAVGAYNGRKENDPGTAFHHWLLEQQLFVPATFSQHHTGEIQHTYVSPDGDRTSRIDYIALPTQLQYDQVETWVAEDIDISTQRIDHLPVLCRMTLTKRVHSAL